MTLREKIRGESKGDLPFPKECPVYQGRVYFYQKPGISFISFSQEAKSRKAVKYFCEF